MMLLTRFYDYWRTDGLPPEQALRRTQQWLRNTTNDEKAQYFENEIPALAGLRMPQQTAEFLYHSLGFRDPNARDFAHPFHKVR